MLTSFLPNCSVSWPGPWPCTSAEGECTRRNSNGRLKREPSSKAISSTLDFWCRTISVGLVMLFRGNELKGTYFFQQRGGGALVQERDAVHSAAPGQHFPAADDAVRRPVAALDQHIGVAGEDQ